MDNLTHGLLGLALGALRRPEAPAGAPLSPTDKAVLLGCLLASELPDLDTLLPGDPIVVETSDTWFVYRMLGDVATGDEDADPSGIPGRQIVRPEDIEVISPTPGAAAGAAPTGAYLTLTTCHPRYSAEQRMIIHARLDATLSKAESPNGPAALNER